MENEEKRQLQRHFAAHLSAASSHGETGREVTATALSQRLQLVEHKVTSHGREGTYATAQVANGEKISLSSQ